MDQRSMTVVIPCLNAARWLDRALDSLEAQQDPHTEVLVVDGGSSDATVEILEQRPGIRYVSEPDRGLSDAVNKGVRLAEGELIGWLNADDVYTPGCLSAVRRAWAGSPASPWLTGYCRIVDASGREIRKAVTGYKNALLRRYSHPLHLTHNFVSAPSTFFTREIFDAVGGLDESLRYSMDYDLYLRFGRQAPPIVLREVLAEFTAGHDSLSATGFETQFVEHHAVARRYRADAPTAVALNAWTSRGITGAYRVMRQARRVRAGASR